MVRRARFLPPLVLLALGCGSDATPPGASLGEQSSFSTEQDIALAPRVEGGTSAEPWRRARALLEAREYSELEGLLRSLQRAFEADPGAEGGLEQAYDVFLLEDPRLEPPLETWVETRPDSAEAHLALAQRLRGRGWEARGGGWASETSEEQFEAMAQLHAKAEREASRALSLDRRLTEAYSTRIDLAKTRSDLRGCLEIAREGLKIAPSSFSIRETAIHCLLPRWGGSWEAMAAIARDAQSQAARNPRLQVLEGFVACDQADHLRRDERYPEAVERFGYALRHGDYWGFYAGRGLAYYHWGKLDRALADLERARELAPTGSDILIDRVRVLRRLGHFDEALSDLTLALDLAPGRRRVRAALEGTAPRALRHATDLVRAERQNEALAVLTPLARLLPDDADVHYWRGRAHLKSGAYEAAHGDFATCLRIDSGHFECARNADWLLAREGRWAQIIEVWGRYLERHPDDAKALLERAGAHRRNGNLDAAFGDLKDACSRGSARACEILGREGGQAG